jgi:hypothetical protein
MGAVDGLAFPPGLVGAIVAHGGWGLLPTQKKFPEGIGKIGVPDIVSCP